MPIVKNGLAELITASKTLFRPSSFSSSSLPKKKLFFSQYQSAIKRQPQYSAFHPHHNARGHERSIFTDPPELLQAFSARMLASNFGQTATMKRASTSTIDKTQKSSVATAASTWSRRARYTLRIPLIARQIQSSSRQTCQTLETALYMPSDGYRSLYEFEQEVCSAIFGALYDQGEKTGFAMYADMEIIYHIQDAKSGCLSAKRERAILDEDNWDEILELVLSGKAKKVELRANWYKSRGSGQVCKDMTTTQTPSNFPARKSLEQQLSTALPSMRSSSGSVSPRRSVTTSTRRSSGTGRANSPVSRTDSGLGQLPGLTK
jgi:hypothetical protein